MFREQRLAFVVHHPQGALVLVFCLAALLSRPLRSSLDSTQQRHCGGLNGNSWPSQTACLLPWPRPIDVPRTDVVPRFSVLAAESTLVTSQKDASGPRTSLCTPLQAAYSDNAFCETSLHSTCSLADEFQTARRITRGRRFSHTVQNSNWALHGYHCNKCRPRLNATT